MLARLETASATASQRDQYEDAKVDSSRTLEFVLAKTGVSKSTLARALGVTTQLVAQMCSPSANKHPGWAAIVSSPPVVRHEFAEILASECGCVLVPRESTESSESALMLAAAAFRESSFAIAESLDAIVDRSIDVAEAERIVPVLRLAIKTLFRLLAIFERALDQRGLVLK